MINSALNPAALLWSNLFLHLLCQPAPDVWAMGCETGRKSAMRAVAVVVGGCGDRVPVSGSAMGGECGQGILNPQHNGRNALNMRAYSNRNVVCYTKRPVKRAVSAPIGEAAGLVAVALGGGFQEGGRGLSASGAPALHIHQPGEKISALPDSGLVLQKKKGRRVETAGETATFNNNTHTTMRTEYIAIDTETGGVRPGRDALLSIAACASWDAPRFLVHLLPAPDARVEPGAIKVNGYSLEKWKERGAVSLFQGLEFFQTWLKARFAEKEGARCLAHNAGFDRMFLDEACALTGLKMPVRHAWRCSMDKLGCLMDRGVIGQGKATLSRLGELAGLWPVDGRPVTHEAGADAEACLMGYQWLLHKEAEEVTVLKNLYMESVRARTQLEMLLEQATLMIAEGRVAL